MIKVTKTWRHEKQGTAGTKNMFTKGVPPSLQTQQHKGNFAESGLRWCPECQQVGTLLSDLSICFLQ